MEYNGPQRHADVYCAPKNETTKLRFADGSEVGTSVADWDLVYDDGGVDGKLRLDNHEMPVARDGHRLVFHRGGKGYRYLIPYGHVRLSDLQDSPGHSVPSENGSAAPGKDLLWATATEIPWDMKYKPNAPGSSWSTYGDAGKKFGYPGRYTYLCWSWLNAPGGGMVRSLIPNGAHVRECDVPRIKSPSYNTTGQVNGDVWGQYVKCAGLYGWMLWCYQRTGGKKVFTVHREA